MKNTLMAFILLGSSFTLRAELPAYYKSMSAAEKQDILFDNASSDPYTRSELSKHSDPTFGLAKLMSVSYLAKSFTNENDEFPSEKTKVIHTYGSVAKVRLNITHKNEYTGLFQTGAKGIIRLSLAKLASPYTPGFALKLLVDGGKSQNIFAMYSLDGQKEDNNFFKNAFSTKINDPESGALKFLANFFKKTLVKLGSDHKDPTLQSTTDVARVEKSGKLVEQSKAPFSLVFKPTKEVEMPSSKGDLRIRLANSRYKPGVTLYKVFAKKEAQSELLPLGEVVLESEFAASKYGDRVLYFQHNID